MALSHFCPLFAPAGLLMFMNDQPSPVSHRRRNDHCESDSGSAFARAPPTGTRQSFLGEQTAFNVLNTSGRMARGIEIELAGIAAKDVFHAFYFNRRGAPGICRTANAVILRFESLWSTSVQTLSLTRQVQATAPLARPYVWEIALLGGGGSERLCLEMSAREVVATYRWLVEKDETEDVLVVETAPAFIHDSRSRIA